nr:DUF1793 domain-containing protein [Mucilaginibacter humi]
MGQTATAQKYSAMAADYAQKWIAKADAGDHYGLVFDSKNTGARNIIWYGIKY